MTISLGKRCVAEAVGMFILVFFGTGGTTPATPFNIGIGALGGLGDWLAIGLAFGIAIAGSIYALGRISGCHINPAVTIALYATRRLPGKDVVPYIAAQLVGAAAASLLLAWVIGPDAVTIGGLGATAPFAGIGYLQAIVIEAIGTFLLMLVIMGVAVDERATPGFAGLMVGLAVAGIITTTGNLTGASLNPARTFGPYLGDWLLAGQSLWEFFPIYIIGPIVGAVLAAFLYDYLTSE